MAFTVQDFEQLLDMLNQRPEWRMKLREVLLNGDGRSLSVSIDRLTEQVRLLTEQVRALTERMDRLEQRVGELERRIDGHDERFQQIDERFQRVDERFQQIDERFQQIDERFQQIDERFQQIDERFQRIDERFQRIDERFQQIDERFQQIDERFQQIDERFQRVDERFQRVDERFQRVDERFQQIDRTLQRMNDQIGELRGETLELRYHRHIGAYFGRTLRRIRTVDILTLEDEIEARLSEDAFIELQLLDILAQGKVRHHPDRPDVWLAIEISATVNTNDVTRARKRADLLCQAGYPTIAVAGGEECSRDAATLAQQHKVVLVQDGGQMTGWDVALEQALQFV